AALLALRAILGRGAPRPASRRELVNAGLIGCVMLGGGNGFLGYAEQTVPSGICALVIGCSPIGFALLDRLLGGPKLTRHQIIGGLIGLGGIVLLSLSGSSAGGDVPR